jgi:hypothetical protein
MRGLSVEPAASLILGSDSPSLEAGQVLHGLDLLGTVDLVLGPAHDGGYYAIGLRRPQPGLLNGIPWSSSRTLAATLEKARHAGLQVATLEPWTDVDRPEDLQVLTEQIARMRAGGDARTATHSESALRDLGLLDGDLNWTGRF